MTQQASGYSLSPARLLSLTQTIMIVIVLVLMSIPSALPSSGNQALKGLHGAPNIYQLTNDLPCGATWEKIGANPIGAIAIAYGNGLYVAVGNRAIVTSPDGVFWTTRDTTIAYWGLPSVTWSGNQFVVVKGNTILTSLDGITWNHSDTGAYVVSDLRGVTWGGNQFVAVGYLGQILTSPDGMTWTPRESGTSMSLTGVSWGNSQFVVVGGTILTSSDGVTWTPRDSNSWHPEKIAWGNGQFVAVGQSGLILTSPDGLMWTQRD